MDIDGNRTHLYLVGIFTSLSKPEQPHPQCRVINSVLQTSWGRNKVKLPHPQFSSSSWRILHPRGSHGTIKLPPHTTNTSCPTQKYKTKHIFIFLWAILNQSIPGWRTGLALSTTGIFYSHLYFGVFSKGPWAVTKWPTQHRRKCR